MPDLNPTLLMATIAMSILLWVRLGERARGVPEKWARGRPTIGSNRPQELGIAPTGTFPCRGAECRRQVVPAASRIVQSRALRGRFRPQLWATQLRAQKPSVPTPRSTLNPQRLPAKWTPLFFPHQPCRFTPARKYLRLAANCGAARRLHAKHGGGVCATTRVSPAHLVPIAPHAARPSPADWSEEHADAPRQQEVPAQHEEWRALED